MSKKGTDSLCPAAKLLSLLSERHMLSLVYNLASGPKGFNDLQEDLEINSATLAKRLNELEGEKVVEKLLCKTDSRRHYYALTKRGKKLSKYIALFSKV